jgi:hypothetical protein
MAKPKRKTKKAKKLGICSQLAAQELLGGTVADIARGAMRGPPEAVEGLIEGLSFRLVHGYPTQVLPDGTRGVRMFHAWVEAGVESPSGFTPIAVCDCGSQVGDRKKCLCPSDYYRAGLINPEECAKYTADEATVLMLRHQHYGTWEKVPADVEQVTE